MIKKGHHLTEEQIAQGYERMASQIKEPRTHYLNVLSEIRKKKVGKVLEIGCGQGKLVQLLIQKRVKCDYFAVDINEAFVTKTRQFLPSNQSNAIKIGTIYTIPFMDASFDTVVLMDVLEHLKDPLKGLLEIHAKLKPGGRLIVTVPNATAFEPTRTMGERTSNSFIQYLFLAWEHPLKSKQPIDTMIYYHEYESMFKMTGFDLVTVQGWNYFPFLYSIPKLNQVIAAILSPLNPIFDSLGWQSKAYSLLFHLKPR